jgi:hypothetical protein
MHLFPTDQMTRIPRKIKGKAVCKSGNLPKGRDGQRTTGGSFLVVDADGVGLHGSRSARNHLADHPRNSVIDRWLSDLVVTAQVGPVPDGHAEKTVQNPYSSQEKEHTKSGCNTGPASRPLQSDLEKNLKQVPVRAGGRTWILNVLFRSCLCSVHRGLIAISGSPPRCRSFPPIGAQWKQEMESRKCPPREASPKKAPISPVPRGICA